MGVGSKSVHVVGVGGVNPENASDGDSLDSQASFFEPEDEQLLQTRRAEIHARDRPDLSRIPESTPPTDDTLQAPAQMVVPAPPVQGPPPRLLNRLKDGGFSTILEEKLLSTDVVIHRYPLVWDTIRYHSDLVPKGKKKASTFRPIEPVVVRGKIVGCNSDHINAALDKATYIEHDYQIMIMAQTLEDLKGWLDPLISDTTPKWIEVAAPIEKKDLNIAAWCWFGFISNSIMPSQNESILRHPKASYLGSIIAKKRLNLGLIIE
uniref:Putative plant transposon protein domain-containing protein n=1 Tax=Solanum tuberosum TaxID=4113 RepID=M1DMQ0_SOLTU